MESENVDLVFVNDDELKRVRDLDINRYDKLKIVSACCRLNALSSVKNAGSGHLGSSFSSMDIMVYLYFEHMRSIKTPLAANEGDIFFSSKGHDCPAQYAVLAAKGILKVGDLLKLRKLYGLEGHPDAHTAGIEANTGSLGMGISKAKGMAIAKILDNNDGEIFVLTGDGELQEGQVWESIQSTASRMLDNITIIVDHNKIQTDKIIDDIMDMGDLQDKFESFGCIVERCDGHDFASIEAALGNIDESVACPKVLLLDTLKGKGVSFMEIPAGMVDGVYKWHSGAPADSTYDAAKAFLLSDLENACKEAYVDPVKTEVLATLPRNRLQMKDTHERIVNSYSDELVELGKKHPKMVVLDADLAADCGLRAFEKEFPERFIECGIAEQDMVSTAGGLALKGYIPVVNSFGTFLSARANEQVFNNSSECTKIVYVCHLAGIIPAGPGKSHQSVRDAALFGSINDIMIVEPCNGVEMKAVLDWCMEGNDDSSMIRVVTSPSPSKIVLPPGYKLEVGKGTVLMEGKDHVIFAYGPVMINEAIGAAEKLARKNISVKVIDFPWLNEYDIEWIEEEMSGFSEAFVMDDHSIKGGLGDTMVNAFNESSKLRGRRIHKIGVEWLPACGTPKEVLDYHGMDAAHVAELIEHVRRDNKEAMKK